MEILHTNRARLGDAGEFDVLLITAGDGNGWEFGAAALAESVPLWNGAECFIDHNGWGRSVRDLAGVFHEAAWDADSRGVRARLKALGPSGRLLEEIGRQMVKPDGKKPRVGFSADLVFSAGGRRVEKILRVLSVDLVYRPARGGAFLRALNAAGALPGDGFNQPAGQRPERIRLKGVFHMLDENGLKNGREGGAANAAQLQQDVEPMRPLLELQKEQARLAHEADAAQAARAEMCVYLLDAGLAASRLPGALQEHVRKQLSGRVFSPRELNEAIDAARRLASELTAGQTIQGPGRVHGMLSGAERLQAAVDDLFEAPRESGMEGKAVERLQGIRELYMTLTGDYDLHGGYYQERAQLATTADFTGLVKNAMNKVVAKRWAEMGRAGYDWWRRIVTVEHMTTLNDITGILVGTVGSLPAVAEGAEYTELAIGDSPETGSFTKYGGYIPLTLELIDRDETRKLKEYPRALASAGLRKISELVAAIFTSNGAVGPQMADGGALFNATAVAASGGHANLRAAALSANEWEAVSTAVYNQPMLVKNESGFYGAGAKMGVNPRFCLVPRALQLTAMKILYPSLENAANIYSQNQQRGQPGDVLTVPEWSDATDWAAVCDPAVAPAIYIAERFGLLPEVYIAGYETSPAVFMNDEHRIKVRHFLSVFVTDFRPLHKSNVA